MAYVRFLLSQRNNPHSALRDNGVRFWGYPTRNHRPRIIVVHTAETSPSPASAENVARWQAFTAAVPSSYHTLHDSDSTVRTLEDGATAFHVRGYNSISLGMSFATRAHLWGVFPEWDREALGRGAAQAAEWCEAYDVPVRWLSRRQVDAGRSGFVRHSVLDPGRRGDPGAGFPGRRFFDLVERAMEGEMAFTAEQAEQMVERAAAAERLLVALTTDRLSAAREALGKVPSAVDDGRWARRIASGRASFDEAVSEIGERAADR